tara:strand:+ start:15933 stop:17117 length:1185 start_codon:yes stop_codon:yes gene_type:complete
MHILESYALQNDLKIDKPHLYEKFFPLAIDKYITIDTSPLGTQAMSYDHWQLVVDLIAPKLKEAGIEMVQLGDKNCRPLTKCYLALGQCNFNHKAYVIKKSLVHVSSNNETSHIASAYDKKSVILYPYNCYIDQFKPYWSSNDNIKILQDSPSGKKPSYQPSENPKSINRIKPETVAAEILRFAGIHTFSTEYKTLRIGASFNNPRIESSLSHLIDAQKIGVSSLIIRMDLNFNEENLVKQLQGCPCSVITNRPLSNEILDNYSSRILELIYYVEDDHDPNFIKRVQANSITYLIRTRKDGDFLKDLKLEYFDYGMIQPIKKRCQEDFSELKDKNNLYYKSKHFIIYNNKFYPSTAALMRNIHASPTMDHEPHEIIDDPLFWEEEEHFQFFEKN